MKSDSLIVPALGLIGAAAFTYAVLAVPVIAVTVGIATLATAIWTITDGFGVAKLFSDDDFPAPKPPERMPDATYCIGPDCRDDFAERILAEQKQGRGR